MNYIICFVSVFVFCFSQHTPLLDLYDFSTYTQHRLDKKLREISGLATTPDGRLFAHDDERGIVYQLNPKTGETIKYFKLGRFITPYNEDFEGIAYTPKGFFMITSNGRLYHFQEGKHNQSVPYTTYNLGLDEAYDLEGLCYDPKQKQLLISAKGTQKKTYKNQRAVFSFSLTNMSLNKTPFFLLDQSYIKTFSVENKFSPSGIEYHKESDHFFIIAARGNLLIEVDRNGTLIQLKTLDTSVHYQPEGIALLPPYLLISDEGKKHGTLTRYKLKEAK